MRIRDPRDIIQREGFGNINYQTPNTGAAALANNGTTISTITPGTVVLGQNVGQAGAPGKLLSSREIPMNGFGILFSGIAGVAGNQLIFQNATAAGVVPQLLFNSSTGAEIGRIRFDAQANGSVYIGQGAGPLSTGQFNTFLGISTGSGNTTGQRNTLIGVGAGQGNAAQFNNCIMIGGDAGDQGGGAVGDFCIFIGQNIMDNGAGNGSNNIVIGGAVNNSTGTAVGNGNLIIGNSIGVGGGLTNSMVFIIAGTGSASMNLSNVIVMGRETQNMLLGFSPLAYADNGNRLQIAGKLNTGGAAPLTLGAGAMDFGKVVTAASVLNATKYLEMSVDGVLVKVCIN